MNRERIVHRIVWACILAQLGLPFAVWARILVGSHGAGVPDWLWLLALDVSFVFLAVIMALLISVYCHLRQLRPH